jgi:hypothetical protein
MELLLPSSKPLEQLELFQKRILKQILSLPMSCLDPVVYILTGILPIEAQIHIKALTFFNNVCHQGEKNTEKKLARRQLTVEVLRTVIIAPYRKAILVLCRFCRCVVGTRDPGRCVHEIHIE